MNTKNKLNWNLQLPNIAIETKNNKKEVFTIEINTLISLMEQFIEELDIKENSKKTYFKGLKKFIEWILQQKNNDIKIQMSKSIIINYKDFLASTAQIKPHTQAIRLVAVKQFFIWAESNLILPNIARNIKGIKKITKQHHKDPLNETQIKELLKKNKNHQTKNTEIIQIRNHTIIQLLLFTGIRIGEITKIKIADIETNNQNSNTIIWIHGKGRAGKDAFVIIMEETLKEINLYIETRKKQGEAITEQSPLFISHGKKTKNKQLTSDGISKIINKELKKRNIKTPKISAHSLRHTFGINAIESGISLYDLQIAMRHSTPSTTQIYLGDIEQKKRKEGKTEKTIFEHIIKKI